MQVHLFSPSLSGWKSHSMEQCFKEKSASISSLKGKRDDERKLRFQLKCRMNHNGRCNDVHQCCCLRPLRWRIDHFHSQLRRRPESPLVALRQRLHSRNLSFEVRWGVIIAVKKIGWFGFEEDIGFYLHNVGLLWSMEISTNQPL